MTNEWVRGSFGLDAGRYATLHGRRTVLAVVHHLTAGTRLADVLPLLENDRRIQVAYTAAPSSPLSGGGAEYIRGLGGLTLPWEQALQNRFDLAVAAGNGSMEHLHAPILTLPHGAGPGKVLFRTPGLGPVAARPVTSLVRERIVTGGRVVPSAVALAHVRHLRLLERECPEALPVAVVAGDPCLDRLAASTRLRHAYRRALGVGRGRRLVLVTSTWGPGSLLGSHPDLLYRIAAELPADRYAVAAVLHPHIWCWSGRRQVLSWYADCLRLGVRLLPPEEGWRAAVIAADRVVGDHGSVTYYAAAMGVPVVLAAFPEDDVVPGSHVARLGAVAPRLDWERPVEPQLDDAPHAFPPATRAALRDDLSSRPGESARILRREMYRLMRLSEPPGAPCVEPVPLPRPIEREQAA